MSDDSVNSPIPTLDESQLAQVCSKAAAEGWDHLHLYPVDWSDKVIRNDVARQHPSQTHQTHVYHVTSAAGILLHVTSLQQLQVLTLVGTKIGDDGARAIAENLRQLTNLNLSDNSIGDHGAWAIAKNLRQLTILNLWNNSIGDDGAREIAENLRQLTILNLGGNRIGEDGARAIAENLRQLTNLDLWSNSIGEDGARAIAENLRQLTNLDLSGNSIGDGGARAIAENLRQLINLHLSINSIGDGGARAIVENLRQLTNLHLSSNSIGEGGARAIAEAIRDGKLTQLQSIRLRGNETGMPDELLHRGDPREIAEHVLGAAADTAAPLAEIKMLLVGQGNVGKSNLRERLFESQPLGSDEAKWFASPQRDATHDAEVCETHIAAPLQTGGRAEEVRLKTWDFGGQNHLHATHRFFFHAQRCIYLLVLNGTLPGNGDDRESNRLTYWLRMIAEYGRLDHGRHQTTTADTPGHRAPVILVRTQCDRVQLAKDGQIPNADVILQHAADLDAAIDQARQQNWFGAAVLGDEGHEVINLGWHDSDGELFRGQSSYDDLRTNHADGCQQLINTIRDAVAFVPDAARPYPDFFHRLRKYVEEQLAVDQVKSISHDTFVKAAEQLGVPETLRTAYLTILRSLGYVLWVGDVKEVEHVQTHDATHRVFNPAWVRRPVYELIQENLHHTDAWMTNDQLQRRLPGRSEGKPGAEYLYRRHEFTDDDRSLIRMLMIASRIGIAKPPEDGFLLPDLLSEGTADDETTQTLPERDGAIVSEEIHLQLPFLTDRVFNRFIGKNYFRIPSRRGAHVTRRSIIFDREFPGKGVCRALVKSNVCPTDGSGPFVSITLRFSDQSTRSRLHDEIVESFCEIIADETDNDSATVFTQCGELQKAIDASAPDSGSAKLPVEIPDDAEVKLETTGGNKLVLRVGEHTFKVELSKLEFGVVACLNASRLAGSEDPIRYQDFFDWLKTHDIMKRVKADALINQLTSGDADSARKAKAKIQGHVSEIKKKLSAANDGFQRWIEIEAIPGKGYVLKLKNNK